MSQPLSWWKEYYAGVIWQGVVTGLFAGVGGFDLALTSNGADKICEDCWDDSMTHDELLAEIDERTTYLGNSDGVYLALRAVVELHKPRDYKAGNWCIGCNADYEYPCPTIQAIEKELG